MKGRQKSLTAFLKATNLSSCLLADLLVLLVMIPYSSSLFFLFSLILFVVLFPYIPFEKGRYFIAYQSLEIPLPPTNARWDTNYQHQADSSNRACALGSSVTGFSVWLCPSPALGGFVPEINLPLAKPALWDPRRSPASIPFWASLATAVALSTFPQLISFSAQWGPFWIPTCML